MKKLIFTLFLFAFGIGAKAQTTIYTLDSCRAMAISNNKDVKMSSIDREIAELNKKVAFSKYLPRVSAAGSYILTSKDIQLISDEQKTKLQNLGTVVTDAAGNAQEQIGGAMDAFKTQLMSDPKFLALLNSNEQLKAIVQNTLPSISGAVQNTLTGTLNEVVPQLAGTLSGLGGELADALCLNTNNIIAGGVTLTQPIYMGGKIAAYNKIADLMAQADESKHSIKEQELIVDVDKAYWQIVDLQSKRKLAQSYYDLLVTLDRNVEKLVENGFATKADGLSVKVKKNEAEVTLIQVDNGLALSRMLLCQTCGLPLNTEFKLADEDSDLTDFIDVDSEIADTAAVLNTSNINRPELNALSTAAEIYKQKVNIVRSEYLPNVVLTGGYVVTNPSSFNGFENKFGGMWTVGVGVKVPIVTSGERIYKTRAAKLEAEKAATKLDETREKIELQVNQCAQRLSEARRRLVTAKSSLAAADENLRFANLGLKEGMIPVSTVLEAQTAWLKAQSTMVQAQIDVKLAKVNFEKAVGSLAF